MEADPDGVRPGGRHAAPRDPAARRRTLASLAGAVAVIGLALLAATVGAMFSATTTGPGSGFAAVDLDPAVPSAVTASRTTATSCLVSWTPAGSVPAGTSYDVTDGAGTLATGVTGTSTTITVPATAVIPTVRARLGGWVSAAQTAAAAPCDGYPDAPTAVVATGGDARAAVSWTAPAGNGSAVASFTVTASPGGATCTPVPATTTSCTVIGLTNGTPYTFTVTAANGVGTGPASAPSDPVTPAAPPAAPASVSVTATGATTATVTWTAPPTDGGSAVTGYTATAFPGGVSCSAGGAATGCGLTELTAGEYTVAVTATTAAGTGPGRLGYVSTASGVLRAAGAASTNAVGTDVTGTWSFAQEVTAATSWAGAGTALSAGAQHTCAVRDDGTLWCWGANASGQLGLGDTTARAAPTRVGSATSWLRVSAGTGHTCATTTDGTLWCWGANGSGQLGDGTATDRTSPVRVGSDTSWSTPAAGESSSCATRTTGTLWCWGRNHEGQLGLGDATDRSSPTLVGSDSDWSAVSVGAASTCGRRTTGTLWCWGRNDEGQLGLGDSTDRAVPAQVGSGTTWSGPSVGSYHACAGRTDGTLWCWGANWFGELGAGDWDSRTSPAQVGSASTWTAAAAGRNATCATRSDGTLWCWGHNGAGQLGSGSTLPSAVPVQAGSATSWTAPTVGRRHTCAVRSTGTLWCAGEDNHGQLGAGTAHPDRTTLDAGLSADATWTALTSWKGVLGGACGVRSDGTLWCWGQNHYAQLGTGDSAPRSAPTRIGTATSWRTVAQSDVHACGTRTDGTLWCWGANWSGQLGDGTTTDRTTPTRIGAGTSWLRVWTGRNSSCALTTDGTLWCWGANTHGQLGDGTTTPASSPVQVGVATTWATLSLGGYHACGSRTDGTLWCWGANTHGQLGDGTTTPASSPVQVGAATSWAGLAAGGYHSCGSRTDGTLWCWGDNGSGQLGDGTTTPASSPVQVGAAASWTTPTTGSAHSCARRDDGTLWCWGGNGSGELGLGTTTDLTAPARTALTDVRLAVAGTGVTFVLARTAPEPPTDVVASPGDGQAGVAWTAPAIDGGAAVTSYTATATPTAGAGHAGLPTRTCTAASAPCTITSLTNGISYAVTVTATNADGTSVGSAATVTPYPAAVMTPTATKVWLDARHSPSLSAATDCSGADAPTGAGIGCWKNRGTPGWDAVAGPTEPVLTANAIGTYPALRFTRTNPDHYDITAPGIGAVGSADRSIFAVVAGRTTRDATTNDHGTVAIWPGYHTGLALYGHPAASSAHATAWTSSDDWAGDYVGTGWPSVTAAVASSGAGTVTSIAYADGTAGPGFTTAGGWRTYPDLLRIGSAYDSGTTDYQWPLDGDIGELVVLDVAVGNGQRRSVEEYLARRWEVPITPAAPQSVSAAAGTGQAGVSWSAPTWDGGAGVASFTATATPGGSTCTTASTSCTITGLTNGTEYSVTVTAANSVGTGPASSAVLVTP